MLGGLVPVPGLCLGSKKGSVSNVREWLGEQVRWCAAETQLVWPHVNINSVGLEELKDLIRIVLWQNVEVEWWGRKGG